MDAPNGIRGAAGSTVRICSPQVVVAGLLSMVAPLVLLLFNSDWFFTREGYLDPWNYVGLFREYLDPDYLPEDYKLARLPWILAGFLVHSAFPPVPAAYVLHAVFLCATSLALFVGLYTSLRLPSLAAVLAMWLGFYTPTHGSGGWDYHNTAAGAFYLATFALLAFPATIAGSRIWLAGAGALAALAIHTNITLVNFLPVLALVYSWSVWLRNERAPSIRLLVGRAAWCLLGAVVVTGLLGAINWQVGRRFLFFSYLIDLVARYVSDPGRNWEGFHHPWNSGWIWISRYLALPAAVFLAGVAFLVISRRRTSGVTHGVASALVVQYLIMALVWIGWQSAGHVALSWDYYAYALIPSCFIALAGLLAPAWPAWCERHWLVTIVATWILLASYLVITGMPGASTAARLVEPFSLVAICALLLVPLMAVIWRPSGASVAILVAAFALTNSLVASSADYLRSDTCKVQPSVYNAIVDAASRLMTNIDPLYARVRIWFDEDELIQPLAGCSVRVAYMAHSIRTMASMGYVIQKFPMPPIAAVPDASLTALTGGDRIMVIITDTPTLLDAWIRRLDTMGLAATAIDAYRVPVLASGFTIHAWKVSRNPDAPAAANTANTDER